MSSGAELKKRKIYFVLGNGSSSTKPDAPGDRKVPSSWSPGKVNTKKKEFVADNFKGIHNAKEKAIPRRRKPRTYKNRSI